MAEALRKAISQKIAEEEKVVVTVSIGVLHTTYCQPAEVLVALADSALYNAKRGDQVVFIEHN
jgi:GGDEF domain-containing protein